MINCRAGNFIKIDKGQFEYSCFVPLFLFPPTLIDFINFKGYDIVINKNSYCFQNQRF